MLREEAIELLYDIQTDAVYKVLSSEKEALEMAIKALEQQPCEDCISRKQALKETKALIRGDYDPEYIIETLKMLPSVTPKAKVGRWIDIQYFKADDTYYRPKCPFCGIEPKEYSNYCPECGARMEEVEE